jgi:outer membrane protein TolC
MMRFAQGTLLCSLLVFCTVSVTAEDDLSAILSSNQNLLFEYDFRNNEAQSAKLQRSWINPVILRYSRDYSEQFGSNTIKTGSFTVSIDQPIFRSGGIYYAIKYAQALRGANAAQIALKKRQLIAQAVTLLFEIRKSALEIKKLQLLIKNDAIDIRQKRESYQAGLLDSSFLDQALLKKNQDEASLLELQVNKAQLEENFGLLSDKEPHELKLPKLRLIDKKSYSAHHLELERDRKKAVQEGYNAKITWAKYLPTLSVHARYTDEDINPLFARTGSGLKEKYRTYGFTLSMPLDINMFADVEASKVAALKAKTQVIEREKQIEEEYRLSKKRLKMIAKKIALAEKNEKLYRNLYRVTKNLAKAGEKTRYDVQMMYHSLQIKKLDKAIYRLDRQIELLKLYAKVNDAI